MEKAINDKTLLEYGFVKKMNLYVKDGFCLCLHKGHTWRMSKANCEEQDVRTFKQLEDYIANPPVYKSSKQKY